MTLFMHWDETEPISKYPFFNTFTDNDLLRIQKTRWFNSKIEKLVEITAPRSMDKLYEFYLQIITDLSITHKDYKTVKQATIIADTLQTYLNLHRYLRKKVKMRSENNNDEGYGKVLNLQLIINVLMERLLTYSTNKFEKTGPVKFKKLQTTKTFVNTLVEQYGKELKSVYEKVADKYRKYYCKVKCDLINRDIWMLRGVVDQMKKFNDTYLKQKRKCDFFFTENKYVKEIMKPIMEKRNEIKKLLKHGMRESVDLETEKEMKFYGGDFYNGVIENLVNESGWGVMEEQEMKKRGKVVFRFDKNLMRLVSSDPKEINEWIAREVFENEQKIVSIVSYFTPKPRKQDLEKHDMIDVISICTDRSLLLIQTSNGKMKPPAQLYELFKSEFVTKVWYDNTLSIERLWNWNERFRFNRMVDLKHLVLCRNYRINNPNLSKISQVKDVGLGYYRADPVTKFSYWGVKELSKKQTWYASREVYFIFRAVKKLRKELSAKYFNSHVVFSYKKNFKREVKEYHKKYIQNLKNGFIDDTYVRTTYFEDMYKSYNENYTSIRKNDEELIVLCTNFDKVEKCLRNKKNANYLDVLIDLYENDRDDLKKINWGAR